MESGLTNSGQDKLDNRIQISNYMADATHDYEDKLPSRTININCIWMHPSKTRNSNPKLNSVHIPRIWIQIPLLESSRIQFSDPKSNIVHIGLIRIPFFKDSTIESRSRFGIIKLFAHLCRYLGTYETTGLTLTHYHITYSPTIWKIGLLQSMLASVTALYSRLLKFESQWELQVFWLYSPNKVFQ